MSKVKMNEESLKALRLPELQEKYAEIVGEPTRSPNKVWLVRKILETAKTRARAPKDKTAASKARASTKTMSVEELQARHHELIGRPTGSTDVAYLRWRLRQAERGLMRIGSEPRVAHGADDILVLPLRMPAPVVERMDEARRRLGLASRAELFRRALHRYFVESGEREVAGFLLQRGDGGTGAGAVPISDARS
ncbi:MAG: ribbon-helix-helix protein, CopG family [Deltaproteobacteria bacterium]|nr:ribbon-helix-helix protein, CopG family [Deltaproteobacteria bacterium]